MEVKIIKRKPIGNPTRKWRQENFILSTFSGIAKDTEKGLSYLKEANFNLVEMGWVDPKLVDEAILAAEKVGVDLLVQDWRYFGGFQDSIRNEIVDGEIEKCIAKCQTPRVLGYYVWDEPYMPADLEIAAVQTDIMEKLDEKRMPFSVAIPSYNGAYQYGNDLFDDYLKRYVDKVNPPVFSLDYYPFHTFKPNDESQLDECPLFKDLFLLRKHSLEKEAPMWFYYQGMDNPEYAYISYEKMAMQAYLALLHGAKALQHYRAINAVIDKNGNKLPAFDDVKKLNGLVAPWGDTLMALTSTGVFHDDAVLANDPKRANYTEDFAGSALFDGRLPHRISIGELQDGEGNRYALLLNRDYLSAKSIRLPLKNAANVYEINNNDGKQVLIKKDCTEIQLELAPAQCVFLRLQPAAEKPYLIEYELTK
ncbi:MAG: hypothetical protein IJY11_04225 [Clostridia bacterium]|nr:hypothetical protein [Clostridia bacterium]